MPDEEARWHLGVHGQLRMVRALVALVDAIGDETKEANDG